MGLVCLGTRHCDIPEVILDGQTGWLCEEGEVNKLAELISRLARNHEEILPMTRQGRQHVEENFSLQSQLQKLGRIYCLQAGQASL
jgi:colanic acid/amylovoran biosynthesis glycosyltransferase